MVQIVLDRGDPEREVKLVRGAGSHPATGTRGRSWQTDGNRNALSSRHEALRPLVQVFETLESLIAPFGAAPCNLRGWQRACRP